MPKPKNPKLTINLDLLKPQSNPEKLFTKIIRWLLSSGRFIFIFVEAIVLIAFITRFKLDSDLASNKEAIDQQIPYIDSLKSYEVLIRQTQLKLSTINSFYSNYTDYSTVLKKIAQQIPLGVKIISINLDKNVDRAVIKMGAVAQNSNDLAIFVSGLKHDPFFSEINITTIDFEKSNLTFSLTAQAKLSAEGKKL